MRYLPQLCALALCVPLAAQTPFKGIDEDAPLYTAPETAALVSNLNVRAAPTGAGVADTHGCVHDAPVEIGAGARATPPGGSARSVSVAIGAESDATDPLHPEKSQAIAIGNQSRAAGVNSIAIGSGVRHDDEDDMSGGNAYASAAQASAVGYAAKATADGAWQLGTGTNDAPWSIKFFDVWVVKDGKVVGGGIDTNAVEGLIRERVTEAGYATLRTGVDTNGYAYALMASYDGETGADGDFRFFAATNPAVAAPLSIQTSGGIVRIYSEQTVDRLIAEAIADYARTNSGSAIPEGVATTNDIAAMHPDFEEWASPTVDRIAASAVAPSTTSTTRGDTYVSTGAASGYALRAVRSMRSSTGMDSEVEIPGAWSIVGDDSAANLSSNVLSSTSKPGDVTVEFAPEALGAATMRAVVSMPGDAVRTSTVWPSGEVASSWRYGVQMDSVVFDPGPPYRLVQTNEWNGTTYICRSALAAMPYLTATAPNPEFGDPAMAQALCVYLDRRRWRNDGGSIAGGFIGVSEHYVLYAVHSGGVPESNYLWTTNWASGAVSAQPSGYANVATWGDLGLRRLTKGVVPPECRAKFLRESTLAELSPSRLIRAIGFAHTQHGAISPCLLEPRPSKADQTGATWDNGWVYLASRDTWRNTEWDGIRELCHDAHGGDSGHIAFFWVRQRLVPIGLFHWAGGSGECLMSDTLLDKIDAAIKRDSGGVESLSFYTAGELQ